MSRIFLFTLLLCFAFTARAEGLSLIRDAETEEFIREIADPIFLEANLVPQNIKIYIVQSQVLNAFVSGGQNMFLHTGLLTWSDDPRVVAGVIAHETGHIAGGHLIRGKDEIRGAGIGTIMSYVLGAATIVAGAPDAGQAIMTGGSHLAQSAYLRHSRSKEESADQAAVTYLDKLGISVEGLIKLLEELNSQQRRQFEHVNPYAQTHPLSSERIQFLRREMAGSKSFTTPAPDKEQERYKRIVAKIVSFLGDPVQVERRYPSADRSFPAEYARAILAHRRGDLATSTRILDSLIAANPEDAYLHELKGQVLYESGKPQESIASYREAVRLKPKASLIQLGLAVSEMATNTPENLQAAVDILRKVTAEEKDNTIAWQQLGVAYGKLGQLGPSYFALAEAAVLRRDREDAARFIALAHKNPTGDATIELRLSDMEEAMKQWKDDDKKTKEDDEE